MSDPTAKSVDLFAGKALGQMKATDILALFDVDEAAPADFNRKVQLSVLHEWVAAQIGTVSLEDAQAGESTTPRLWPPALVAAAIEALEKGDPNHRYNLAASAAPTATDDSASDPAYSAGSVWRWDARVWLCVDATPTAAVWVELTSEGGALPYYNLAASAAPTATDDAASDPAYAAGSLWRWAARVWLCADPTATAAVWVELTSEGGGDGDGLGIEGLVTMPDPAPFSTQPLTQADHARRIVSTAWNVTIAPQTDQAWEAGDFFVIQAAGAITVSRGTGVTLRPIAAPSGDSNLSMLGGASAMIVRGAEDEWVVASHSRALPDMSQGIAEAGTDTAPRATTAQRMAQAILAQLPTITQAAAEAGTATTRVVVTAQRLAQAIAALGGGGIRKVTSFVYTPGSAQTLADTYADVDGSSRTVTPTASGKTILYLMLLHQAAASTADALVHYEFHAAGSEVPAWRNSQRYTSDGVALLYGVYTSAGTSGVNLKFRARRFSSATTSKLHETNQWNGGTSSQLANAFVLAIEFQ